MNLIDWLLDGLDIRWWDVMLAALVAITVAAFAVTAPRFSGSLGKSFANQHRAYVDVGYVRQFDRATLREQRRRQLLLAGPLVLLMLVFTDDGAVLKALAPGLLALALCAESILRLRQLGHEFKNPAAPSGVARARAVGVRDFIGPASLLHWLGIALVAAAIIAGTTTAVARDGLTPIMLAHALSAASLCLLVVTLPIVWHFMVSRPERSEDAAHLYLQDAWRANLLRETTSTAHMPALFLLVTISDTSAFPFAFSAIAFVGLLPALFISLLLVDTNLHFRKRLWPMLTPGQVLMPGDAVPSGSPA